MIIYYTLLVLFYSCWKR